MATSPAPPIPDRDPSAAVSVVVTDLDGTLWHTDDRVAPVVVDALAALAARGVPLLVATGRRLTSTRVPLARIGIAPPAVVLNGALGVDLASGDRFHRHTFPTDEAVSVHEAFASLGLAPVIYVDHPRYDVFLGPEPSTHPEHVVQLGSTARTDDLARVVRQETVLAFSMIGVDPAMARAAADAVGDEAETHVDRSLDYAGAASLTVAPRGLSKWDGVLAFCRSRRLDPTRVLALADGPNDLELLANASVRLVPEVAHPEALALADHVIPAAVDGGWAAVLDHLA